MKLTNMFFILVIFISIDPISSKSAEVIVIPKNPIILDSNYQAKESQSLIMSASLRTVDFRRYAVQGLKLENFFSLKDNDSIDLYRLRNFSVIVDGIEINTIDSLTPESNFLSANLSFALGSLLEIRAKFPDGAIGTLKIKIKIYFQKFEQPVYEQFEFIQTVYAGIELETTSISNLEFNKIRLYRDIHDDKIIILKDIPLNTILRVYDLKGSLVYENKRTNIVEEIDFKKLSDGFYIITVRDDTNYEINFYRKVVI